MELSLPTEWEEMWKTEKEERRKLLEEGGERREEDERRLRWIVEYNSRKLGVRGSERRSGRHRAVDTSKPEQTENCGRREDEEDEEEFTHWYCRHTYVRELFQSLKELQTCKLLTDLTFRTTDGGTLSTHYPVMAAVSSRLRQHLLQRGGNTLTGRDSDPVPLGPGLAAVVDFAYTGAISGRDSDPVPLAAVQAAAVSLEAPRVLELCHEEEKVSSEEQLKVNLQSITRLWTERKGCDVELEAEGKVFHAHRVILAASSDYFRAMFTSGMQESQRPSVSLRSLGAPELEVLLRCSYTGALALSWGSVFEFTSAALHLQAQPALSLCLQFLHEQMDTKSCLDVASFAEAYGLDELLELAKDFVLCRFQEVAATPKFLDLPLGKLLEYLQCDSLCVPSELVVFRAVVAWIEADTGERLALAKEVMRAVRFPLMTFREFREVRAISLRMECRTERKVELYGAALREFGFSLSDCQEKCRVRRPRDALLVVGGDQLDPDFGQRRPSRQLWFANSLRSRTGLVKEVEWRLLGEMPGSARFRHAVAVLEGQLYVIGGCHFYAKADTLRSAYRYDPLQENWQRLADMQECRSNFSVVVRGGRLYAIGGDKDINNNLDSVECYCPDSSCWSFVHPLDQAMSGHAVALWDGDIFISGGFNCKYQCLVSMSVYHPERGTTRLSDMSEGRSQHCMQSLDGRLYVAGGVSNCGQYYTDQLSCEIYDPLVDCWSSCTPLPTPHVSPASAVLEGKVYVLGGYCQEDYSEPGLIHRYNPVSCQWENMGRLPGPSTDMCACLLRLPAHLRL